MTPKRWLRIGVAALLGLALLSASNLGTAADPTTETAAERHKALGAKIVQQVLAADELIECGLENEWPTTVIAGVELLIDAYQRGAPEEDRTEVKKEPLYFKKAELERLKGLIDQALAMRRAREGVEAKTIRNYAMFVIDKCEFSRGTAARYTRTPFHLEAGAAEWVKVKLDGDKTAIIHVAKTKNVGVPIKVTVSDQDDKIIPPLAADPRSYDFPVGGKKTVTYKITVEVSEGKVPCDVMVTTN